MRASCGGVGQNEERDYQADFEKIGFRTFRKNERDASPPGQEYDSEDRESLEK